MGQGFSENLRENLPNTLKRHRHRQHQNRESLSQEKSTEKKTLEKGLTDKPTPTLEGHKTEEKQHGQSDQTTKQIARITVAAKLHANKTSALPKIHEESQPEDKLANAVDKPTENVDKPVCKPEDVVVVVTPVPPDNPKPNGLVVR